VKTLKDLVQKVKVYGGTGDEARHSAYFYPMATAIEAAREKVRKLEQMTAEAEAKLPSLREELESAKQVCDTAIKHLRDPKLKQELGIEKLREMTNDAKKALAAKQRELTALEAKVTQMRSQARGNEAREREEEAFRRIEREALYGKAIAPCFSEEPIIQRQANAVKKLSDEEEARLRALEIQESVRKKKQAEEEAATKAPSSPSATPSSSSSSRNDRSHDGARGRLSFMSGIEEALGVPRNHKSSLAPAGGSGGSGGEQSSYAQVTKLKGSFEATPKSSRRSAAALERAYEPDSEPCDSTTSAHVQGNVSSPGHIRGFMESATNSTEQEKM